ncbi:MAG: 6-bladed beta-propeller [Gemmatimonadetes bacterium]|nr:6-bladed beta-propeller [Gemmatimonadota bacterium]
MTAVPVSGSLPVVLQARWHRASTIARGRSGRLPASIACLLMCFGGCVERTAPPSTARDSAGVTIVENEAPLLGAALSALVSGRPLLDLGGPDAPPEQQFEDIVGVLQSPDRGFVVADRGRRQLLFYDASGRHRVTVGGPGQGPGEFQDIGAVAISGDSILAFDFRQGRLSVFGLDGAFRGTAQLEPTPDERHPIQFYNLAGLLDGHLLMIPWAILPLGQREQGSYWDSASVYVYGLDGVARGRMGEPYRTEMYVGSRGSSGLPFGARTSVASDGARLIMGTGKRFELSQYDVSGTLTRIVRRRWEPRPVTPAAADSLLAHVIRGVGATSRTDPRAEARVCAFEEAPLPEHMPAFAELLTDPRGNLWVRRYSAEYEDGARRWSVFDQTGAWLGDLTTPEGFEVLTVNADAILGVWRDPLDVQHIRVYGLDWPASSLRSLTDRSRP